MLDSEDFYHDEARERKDLAIIMKTVESVCSTLGFQLGQTWTSYLTEFSKFPWTTICLISLELEKYDQDIANRVLYVLYYKMTKHLMKLLVKLSQ